MAWVKIDDNIFNHPKMVAAGHLGQHLQIRALAYCNQYLTDGFICADALHMSIGLHTVDLGDGKPRKVDMMAVVARLVKVGVWDRVEGGYMIHDYFDYQPSRASLKEKQERISEARRAAGLKSGQVRRAKGGVNKGTNDEQLVQEVVQRGRQDPSANAAPRGDQSGSTYGPRDLPARRHEPVDLEHGQASSATSALVTGMPLENKGTNDEQLVQEVVESSFACSSTQIEQTTNPVPVPVCISIGCTGTHDGREEANGDDETGNVEPPPPPPDPLVERWLSITGRPGTRALTETVVAHLRRSLDWHVIDEQIGWCAEQPTTPHSPRYLFSTCQRFAAAHGIEIPDLEDVA